MLVECISGVPFGLTAGIRVFLRPSERGTTVYPGDRQADSLWPHHPLHPTGFLDGIEGELERLGQITSLLLVVDRRAETLDEYLYCIAMSE